MAGLEVETGVLVPLRLEMSAAGALVEEVETGGELKRCGRALPR